MSTISQGEVMVGEIYDQPQEIKAGTTGTFKNEYVSASVTFIDTLKVWGFTIESIGESTEFALKLFISSALEANTHPIWPVDYQGNYTYSLNDGQHNLSNLSGVIKQISDEDLY